ncbi:acetyltransferase [Flavobacterium agrisoli]|uniref:Acetyltransferase n=1 Tax=Flavobacterium agrisoli TaxID=2793066 RepID=A0A934UKS9_9FLAO|nr:acetyltransferase [Flavobacterium agrisoli]MBK0371282.1 acetyltransferase [Flavobacterium agrisoli]
MEKDKVVLYGASGHCKVIVDILGSNQIDVAFIVDDDPKCKTILGNLVVRSENCFTFRNVIVSIGNNSIRKKIVKKLNSNFTIAIHSKAVVSQYVSVGEGTVIMAGAIVNPAVQIGKHCIVNTAATLDHDCVLGDFVHVSPNASLAGGVHVGEGTHVGIGAIVIQGVVIGKWAIIGAGAVILRDVPDYAVVVGNPGRVLRYVEEE